MKSKSIKKHPLESRLSQLSIRSNLLISFGAVIALMTVSVLAAVVFLLRSNTVVTDMVTSTLPTAAHSFQVARAADALAASGLSLSDLTTNEARDMAFVRIDHSIMELKAALRDQKKYVSRSDLIPLNLYAELEENIRQLQSIVDERIAIRVQEFVARKALLSNQLLFERHLLHRMRILEGEGDVLQRMLRRPKPPVDNIIDISGHMAKMLPVARFYNTVESMHGRLLAASLSPTMTKLNTSRQELVVSLASLQHSIKLLPESLHNDLSLPIQELERLTLGNDGLIQLRAKKLLLIDKIKKLNTINQEIIGRVNIASSKMVNNSQNEMVAEGEGLILIGKRSIIVLAILAGIVFLCVAGVMHFYVDGRIIARLSWLSEAMQDVATGRLDTKIPPAGPTELGQLGAALQQFRNITAEARSRENALQRNKLNLQQAMEELQIKTSELEKLAITDSLTGLANRMSLDNTLRAEMKRFHRHNHNFSIILMDLDYFKKINDQLGHQAGDKVLKNVARTIQRNVRQTDCPGRWGGEEFMIICPETDIQGGAVLANKIRQELESWSAKGVATVTASFGVTQINQDDDEDGLLIRVDAALYKAKKNGRNRVELA